MPSRNSDRISEKRQAMDEVAFQNLHLILEILTATLDRLERNPGDAVDEFIVDYWISFCRRYLKLPTAWDHLLSEDFWE